jgi:hypothetical protein
MKAIRIPYIGVVRFVLLCALLAVAGYASRAIWPMAGA